MPAKAWRMTRAWQPATRYSVAGSPFWIASLNLCGRRRIIPVATQSGIPSIRYRDLGTPAANHEPDALSTRRIHERPGATVENIRDFRSERLADIGAKHKIGELRWHRCADFVWT